MLLLLYNSLTNFLDDFGFYINHKLNIYFKRDYIPKYLNKNLFLNWKNLKIKHLNKRYTKEKKKKKRRLDSENFSGFNLNTLFLGITESYCFLFYYYLQL